MSELVLNCFAFISYQSEATPPRSWQPVAVPLATVAEYPFRAVEDHQADHQADHGAIACLLEAKDGGWPLLLKDIGEDSLMCAGDYAPRLNPTRRR
jgi:hypothetical protein